jgi:hypothetical protein
MTFQYMSVYIGWVMFQAARGFFLAFVIGGTLSVWVYHAYSDDPALVRRVQELEQENGRLQRRMAFLRDRKRVAILEVLEQTASPDTPGGKRTHLSFHEVDPSGKPLGAIHEFTLDGDVVYIDAQVIKFDESFLTEQDLAQGSTLLLFRRLFGEFQAPADGFSIDQGAVFPPAYTAENQGEFATELWQNFWEYANRPEVIRRSGIHAMHGEAPYIKVIPGGRYELELRRSDGLSIRPMD